MDKTKLTVKKITVYDLGAPVQVGTIIEIPDNSPPALEDCVAVDYLRQRLPTAFSNVVFELDKGNRLFVRLKNVNYASKIPRRSYMENDLLFRCVYQEGKSDDILYYSIEK